MIRESRAHPEDFLDVRPSLEVLRHVGAYQLTLARQHSLQVPVAYTADSTEHAAKSGSHCGSNDDVHLKAARDVQTKPCMIALLMMRLGCTPVTLAENRSSFETGKGAHSTVQYVFASGGAATSGKRPSPRNKRYCVATPRKGTAAPVYRVITLVSQVSESTGCVKTPILTVYYYAIFYSYLYKVSPLESKGTATSEKKNSDVKSGLASSAKLVISQKKVLLFQN